MIEINRKQSIDLTFKYVKFELVSLNIVEFISRIANILQFDMAELSERECRLMQLDCIRENVENILREHRMLGQRYARRQQQLNQGAGLSAVDIGVQMDQMRMRVFQIILNTVPQLAETPEEIGRVSEMINLLVTATNEFSDDNPFHGLVIL